MHKPPGRGRPAEDPPGHMEARSKQGPHRQLQCNLWRLVPLLVPMGMPWCLKMVLLCFSLITNNAEPVFMFIFHTHILSGEAPVHVFSLFSHWLSSNLVEFWELFIYCGYQAAIGNVGCTYSPQP